MHAPQEELLIHNFASNVPPQRETLLVYLPSAHSGCSFQFLQALVGYFPIRYPQLTLEPLLGLLSPESCSVPARDLGAIHKVSLFLVLACLSTLPSKCALHLATSCHSTVSTRAKTPPSSTPSEALLSLLPPSPQLASQQPQGSFQDLEQMEIIIIKELGGSALHSRI